MIEGETILINLANGVYYSMDKVGGLIWEMIEGRHTLGEMVEAVTRRYEVSRDQAEADVQHLAEETAARESSCHCRGWFVVSRQF